jgi:hypothetical protein
MKFKKIVGFGDSWMFGDELLDAEYAKVNNLAHAGDTQNILYRESHCFLGLLGNHYNVPVENFGIPGGSLTSTQWTFQWWLDHEIVPLDQCLLLVGLTNSFRISHYNPAHIHFSNDPVWNKFVHSTWIDCPDPQTEIFKDMLKQQIVLTVCPDWEKINYQNSLLFFDGIAARRNLKLFQFNIANEPISYSVPTKIWNNDCLENFIGKNNHLCCTNKHPNEQGHRLIADRLISQIDSCTMYEC